MNLINNCQAENNNDIFISTVLCTHNHAARLRKTLNSLKTLIPPTRPWEFLVIDNNCTDETANLLTEQQWRPDDVPVRIVREEKLGLSNARNRALSVATGKYLLFLDDDETPDPRWLLAYEREMLTHSPDALGGRIDVLFEHGNRPPWLREELLGFLGQLDRGKAHWMRDPSTPFYGGNFAVRRDVFDIVGDFDTDLGRKGRVNAGGEDTDFYRRLLEHDQKIYWVPTAIINHRIRADKLRRGYFLDLHYQLGLMEGTRNRGTNGRIPPRYLFGQLLRSLKTTFHQRFRQGKDRSLRVEMNSIYFVGYLLGWAFH
jgi:glycosyltransferase involved in cell wall biosynthesis